MSLKNATVVVLGGSSGIGLATAKAARTEGARLIIAGRSEQRLLKARAEFGDAARTVVLDVADESGTRSFFQGLDHLDHLFITAGALVRDSRLAPDTATLQPAMHTRFWGALYAAKYGAQRMNGSGSITFMSGTAATRPPGRAVCCFGLLRSSRSLCPRPGGRSRSDPSEYDSAGFC